MTVRLALRLSLLPVLLVAGAGTGLGRPPDRRPPDRSHDREAARRQIEDADRAREAELDRQKAAAARTDAAAAEATRLAQQRVLAAARLRSAELATLDAASRMEALARRRAEAETKLQARASDLAPLLPAIERLSLYPAETLLAVEAEPDAAVRGILVLQGIGRTLEQQARALRAEKAALDDARNAVAAEAPKLAAAKDTQQEQAASLDRQIADARARGREAADDAAEFARAAAADAARAGTLRDALGQIETARRTAEAQARREALRDERQQRRPEADAARRRQAALARPATASLTSAGIGQGQLTAPVAGTLVRAWGEATDGGPASGISYRASPGARVVAPCGGRVAFAAPFRSYGLLLILDCGGGYHVVLAGLERLDVQAGAALQPGEPVGVMPGWDPKASGDRPSLYVELRHEGRAVNPAPWLRGRG